MPNQQYSIPSSSREQAEFLGLVFVFLASYCQEKSVQGFVSKNLLPQAIMRSFQSPEIFPSTARLCALAFGTADVCGPHGVWPQNNCATALNRTHRVPCNLALVCFFLFISTTPLSHNRTTCNVPDVSHAASPHSFWSYCRFLPLCDHRQFLLSLRLLPDAPSSIVLRRGHSRSYAH